MDSLGVIVAIAAVVALAALVVALIALRRGSGSGLEPFDGFAREVSLLKGEISAAFGHTHQRLQTITDQMAVIDSARANIEELANVLGDKKARGAFGETLMEDLVKDVLPAGSRKMYEMQATLTNGMRVDCLILLPKPPGPIGVDAKFPLESFRAIHASTDEASRVKARRQFSIDVSKHVKDIAGKYIVAGETADWALMFVPSEAVYAEIHANFPKEVAEAHKQHVGIVSPTTLMAVLMTVRAIVLDAEMVERAKEIRAEVQRLKEDADRLDKRAEDLEGAFNRTVETLRQVRISASRITERIGRIAEADVAAPPDKNF